jgi:ParB family chromosome partitioning protein
MADALEDVVLLDINKLHRGVYQPRELFDPAAMEATKSSIKDKGQKIPVIVRGITQGNPLFDPKWTDVHYELADGERRYRCCKELGFKTIKAMVRDLDDSEMLDYALTTNDSLPLNPIEKARVFSRMVLEFGKSQEEIAKSFNLKQQQVSEFVRLLELPSELQELTARAVITVRHARELLKVSDSEKVIEIGKEIASKRLSTRDISKKVKEFNTNIGEKSENKPIFSDIKPQIAEKTPILSNIDSINKSILPIFIYNICKKWSDIPPERLLTLFLLSILLPATVFFVLYIQEPIFGVALGAVFASILVFEKLKHLK